MYQEVRALFLYCLSPVHMGAGTSFGAIDSPIQRERHTNHPLMAGSGIKGALRHMLARRWERELVTRLFGPGPQDNDSGASDHAGAVGFSDAQVVAFPVRSLKSTFVYATCPLALARLRRSLSLSGLQEAWPDFAVAPGEALVVDPQLLSGNRLVLETFEFVAREDATFGEISQWLADHALPEEPSYDFFREKLLGHLVLLSDDDFGHFAENSTVVEPHVRIDDVTGTADDGGLFYVENLPPESLLLSLALATQERQAEGLGADEVIAQLETLDGQLCQFGGDATTGRGLCTLRMWGGSHAESA